MINHTIIEGIVTPHIWRYDRDTCFRLRNGDGFHTVRLDVPELGDLPVTTHVEPGMRVVVSGELVGREEDMGLAAFVRRAEGGTGGLVPEEVQEMSRKAGAARFSYTEIKAFAVTVISRPRRKRDGENDKAEPAQQ